MPAAPSAALARHAARNLAARLPSRRTSRSWRVAASPAAELAMMSDGREASAISAPTAWFQRTVVIPAKARGCHVITRTLTDACPELGEFSIGIAHVFLLHTSASLTINENASPDVPLDLADAIDRLAPESQVYRHADEGADDMPAHIKCSLMGASLTVPITAGALALGTWQGIYLNEHREAGGPRRVTITVQGVKDPARGRHTPDRAARR